VVIDQELTDELDDVKVADPKLSQKQSQASLQKSSSRKGNTTDITPPKLATDRIKENI